jgi:cytochrome b
VTEHDPKNEGTARKQNPQPVPSPTRRRILVWDLPVRLIHWSMAGTFFAAFAIANLVSKRSPAFAMHMLIGLVLGFVVVLRILWGWVGSRPARFGSFAFGPAAVLRYVREAWARRDEPHAGHNPGASWVIFAMLLLPLGLVVTGLVHAFEDAHEVLAWSMLVVVGAHLIGVAWHTLRHRDPIALSMVHGHQRVASGEGIRSTHPLVAGLFLAATALWALGLYRGFDPANRRLVLPLIGKTIALGEDEQGEEGEHEARERKHERRHDHDDD